MLKVLCGYAVAEMLINSQREKILGWKPSLEWLEIVFEGKKFPFACGIYLATTGNELKPPVQVTRKALRLASRSPNDNIFGLRMWLFEIEFFLNMDPSYCQSDDIKYLPAGISYFDETKTKAVIFDGFSGPVCHFKLMDSPDGALS